MMLSQNHIVGLHQLYSIVTVYCCSKISIRAKKMMEERNLFAHYQGTMTKPFQTNNIWYILALCITVTPKCNRAIIILSSFTFMFLQIELVSCDNNAGSCFHDFRTLRIQKVSTCKAENSTRNTLEAFLITALVNNVSTTPFRGTASRLASYKWGL